MHKCHRCRSRPRPGRPRPRPRSRRRRTRGRCRRRQRRRRWRGGVAGVLSEGSKQNVQKLNVLEAWPRNRVGTVRNRVETVVETVTNYYRNRDFHF